MYDSPIEMFCLRFRDDIGAALLSVKAEKTKMSATFT